jgi:hypothetical protein
MPNRARSSRRGALTPRWAADPVAPLSGPDDAGREPRSTAAVRGQAGRRHPIGGVVKQTVVKVVEELLNGSQATW